MREDFAMTDMKKSSPAQLACARMDSCFGDPAVELAEALDEDNLRLFVDILCLDSLDVNKELEQRDFSSILFLAVSKGKEDFVRELAKHAKINPNLPHRTSKNYPIHVAAEAGNVRMLL